MIDESKNKVNDIFGAFLIEESNWVGTEEYPRIEEWMVPTNPPIKMIPFDKVNEIKDTSKYFICFYCKDESFTKILKNPKKYVNMLRKSAGIIGFDYSIYTDMPIIKQKSQIYNNLSLSYFFGYNGIPIIPNIRYGVDDTKEDFLKAVPKNALVAFGTYGFIKTVLEQQVWFDTLHKVIHQLNPSGVIVYGSLPNDLKRWMELYQVPIYLYESYTSLRMKEVKKMPTKGKSNLYGRGKRGQSNEHTNYKYARLLSPKHLEDHIIRHGIQEMKFTNENQYKAAAISFANRVDRENHDSFVRVNGVTLKFSKTTKEFVVVNQEGTVTTYYKTSEKWWESEKRKNGRQ